MIPPLPEIAEPWRQLKFRHELDPQQSRRMFVVLLALALCVANALVVPGLVKLCVLSLFGVSTPVTIRSAEPLLLRTERGGTQAWTVRVVYDYHWHAEGFSSAVFNPARTSLDRAQAEWYARKFRSDPAPRAWILPVWPRWAAIDLSDPTDDPIYVVVGGMDLLGVFAALCLWYSRRSKRTFRSRPITGNR